MWEEPESRSTLVGIAGVILFYLLLWLLGPYILQFDNEPLPVRPSAAGKQFNIELAPDTFAKAPPKPVDPFKFVETNPDAPENTPDKTQNFSDRNQQVAQEKPAPTDLKSDRPETAGKKDFESNQIVSGRLIKPVQEAEAVPEIVTPPTPPTEATPRAEQNPLPGFEKKEGEDKQSFGSNIAKVPNVLQPAREKVEGQKDVPLVEGLTAVQPTIDPRRPQPRPQLTREPQVRPAILAENKLGSQNIGAIGRDAKWSNYGEYLQRMINVVQVVWESQLVNSKIYPPSGTSVTVKFVMNDAGNIAQIVNVESTSNDLASRACVTAITERAPYGAWTDDMKAVLGTRQEMTFTFYYQ